MSKTTIVVYDTDTCPFRDRYDGYCGLKRVLGEDGGMCVSFSFFGAFRASECPLYNRQTGERNEYRIKGGHNSAEQKTTLA